MTASKTWTTAVLLAATVTTLAAAEGPKPHPIVERPVWVIDPALPEGLTSRARREVLHELEASISGLFTPSVRLQPSTGTLLLRESEAGKKAVTEFVAELRRRVAADVAGVNALHGGEESERLVGAQVTTSVQLVMASTAGTSDPGFDPALAGALTKALGFTAFQVVGRAMAEGVTGEVTKIDTQLRWGGDHEVSLEASMKPYADPQGRTRVQGAFRVAGHPTTKDGGGEAPFSAQVETTYAPKAGRPLVVGASPLSQDRSLVFLVTHEGPGVR